MLVRMDDRRWELIQMLIDADLNGKPLRPLASRRTLFGIKSTPEQVMDDVAREMEERARKRVAAAGTQGDASAAESEA